MIFNMQEIGNGRNVDYCFHAHDLAVEKWLRDEVAPAYDEYKAGTNKTSSLEDVRKRVEAFMAATEYKN
jgi:antitoxin ParD1/3/4